jgi:hypothetical protein
MLRIFVDVLRDRIPEDKIASIYFKGSAQKEWDTPLDYVPELSDVDLHILLEDNEAAAEYIQSIDKALLIRKEVEDRYFKELPNPIHLPRPQLTVLNTIQNEPDFIQSPRATVSVLYGGDYIEDDYGDDGRIRILDMDRLLDIDRFITDFAYSVIDKPGKYLPGITHGLSWRVSPLGPRLLTVSGKTPIEVWSLNRTKTVEALLSTGYDDFARLYSTFYLSGWDYFLSDYRDFDAAALCVESGVNALREALRLAESIKGNW